MADIKKYTDYELDLFWTYHIENMTKPRLMEWIIELLPESEMIALINNAKELESDDDEDWMLNCERKNNEV